MSQLPDVIYVPEESKYGTLDYVIAYLDEEYLGDDGYYKRENLQPYIPSYRCEERVADIRRAMIGKVEAMLENYIRQLQVKGRPHDAVMFITGKQEAALRILELLKEEQNELERD